MQRLLEKNSILIVDDEPFNLDVLEYALEALKHVETIRAANGYEALGAVESMEIDLIILDISMPGLDGLEVLRMLKSDPKTRFIPVIVATVKSEDRYKALELGSEDFLSKPIDTVELKFRVENLLKLKKYNDLQHYFNIRLEEEIAKKEQQLKKLAQVEQELRLAREIQQSLIPHAFPPLSDLQVYGSCTQASEVGGDYFDTFLSECGRYSIFVMADVSGHGFASALIAMQVRTLTRAELIKSHVPLSEAVARINTVLCGENEESSMFVTALFLRYDHSSGEMEQVNAGHYSPYGRPAMEHRSGIPMGIQPDVDYTSLRVPFPAGSCIILYTDGIIEETNGAGEKYGERFYQAYDETCSAPPEELHHELLRRYYAFIEQQNDDVTLLVIRAAFADPSLPA